MNSVKLSDTNLNLKAGYMFRRSVLALVGIMYLLTLYSTNDKYNNKHINGYYNHYHHYHHHHYHY